jgi:hypothetical protein
VYVDRNSHQGPTPIAHQNIGKMSQVLAGLGCVAVQNEVSRQRLIGEDVDRSDALAVVGAEWQKQPLTIERRGF